MDALRDAGIVRGPDEYGNWAVPTGDVLVAGWEPGQPVERRVMVRSSGVLCGASPENQGPTWNMDAGCWNPYPVVED